MSLAWNWFLKSHFLAVIKFPRSKLYLWSSAISQSQLKEVKPIKTIHWMRFETVLCTFLWARTFGLYFRAPKKPGTHLSEKRFYIKRLTFLGHFIVRFGSFLNVKRIFLFHSVPCFTCIYLCILRKNLSISKPWEMDLKCRMCIDKNAWPLLHYLSP